MRRLLEELEDPWTHKRAGRDRWSASQFHVSQLHLSCLRMVRGKGYVHRERDLGIDAMSGQRGPTATNLLLD